MTDREALDLPSGPHGMPRREVERIQRERLLGAMARVVAEVGYEATSVEQVLGEAGVSRKTFYELFENKEDCFVALYDEAVRRVLRTVVDAYRECEEPERRIEHALDAFLALCADEPDLARACIVEVFAAGARARERRADAMERLAELMERALGELRGDAKLDRLAAHALVGAVHELIYLPVDRRDDEALRGMAGEIVATQIAPLTEARR